MSYERKRFTGELKADSSGSLAATFSRFNVVDLDGDVTLASAFRDGASIVLGSYNHSSVSGSALPIGVGYIRNDGTRAQIVAEFFNTADAQAERETIKGLGDLAEFSYSFKVVDASTDYAEIKDYPGARRILKSLDVIEACAVIRGAGIGTGTDAVKRSLVRIDGLAELQVRLAAVRDAGLMRLDDELVEFMQHQEQSRFVRI